MDMRETLTAIVREQLSIEGDIPDEAEFIGGLGADSLDIVEIVVAIESAVGITIPDEDIPELKTFGDAVRWLEKHSVQ